MLFKFAAFVFAGFAGTATLFLGKIPFFAKRALAAKMLCSLCFVLCGVCSVVASGFTPYAAFMLGGLLLGALGDFFLDYMERKYFLWGALFFGAGHILYILNFITGFKASLFVSPYLGQIIGLTAFMAFMSAVVVLLNKLRFHGEFKWMIPYALVLLASFIVSFSRGMVLLVNGDYPMAICLLGASALFIASDTSLAISMFGTPPHVFFEKMTKWLVNVTYFPAQALFALSIMFYCN